MKEKYFMMSKRFDKESPADFGLVPSENADTFILPLDNSIWQRRALYDFGWGKENGYYKMPLPKFDELVNIALNTECCNDRYGAAAIILDDYADELLFMCQNILLDEQKT